MTNIRHVAVIGYDEHWTRVASITVIRMKRSPTMSVRQAKKRMHYNDSVVYVKKVRWTEDIYISA